MFGYVRLDVLLILSISIGILMPWIVRIHWRKRTLMLVVAVGLAVVGGMVATGSAASTAMDAAAAAPGRFGELAGDPSSAESARVGAPAGGARLVDSGRFRGEGPGR